VLVSYSKSKFYGALIALVFISSCASWQSAPEKQNTIENPFGNYNRGATETNNITLRSKRGDQAMEVEFPEKSNSDMVIPMNSKYMNGGERSSAVAGVNEVDYQYSTRKPTLADREIASTFGSHNNIADETKRHEIEGNLGLQSSDEAPNMDESYLAKIDVVKQLFKNYRYEAAIIEIDQMVRIYPTNSRLYEMRGTLLDRMGYPDLALRSWKQAAELDPSRLSLKKTIEKRETQRSVASERK
jgi:tetratricopeptide (TPR) repeat protein